MSIDLTKGASVSLTDAAGPAGLTHVLVGLGWDAHEAHPAYDLDASAFLTDGNDLCAVPGDFVYYNAPQHSSGSVRTGPDNRDGLGDGDDETLEIVLPLVPETVEKIRIVVSIDDAAARGHHFGAVDNAFVRVENATTGAELARLSLSHGAMGQDCLVFGEIYRVSHDWHFRAVGEFASGGLSSALAKHGLGPA